MNDELYEDTPEPRPSGRRRRVLSNLGWMVGGAVFAVLLVADPLDLHPIDSWMHDLFGHRHRDGGASVETGGEQTDQLWTCGMHPQVILEEPGQCPICGMNLVPLAMDAPGHDHMEGVQAAAATEWTCEDHPSIRESEPGDCPIDGKPLVPVEPTPESAGASRSSRGPREVLFYRNPMDPTITSPVPSKDSMGMDYVPVYSDEVDAAASQGAVVTIDPAVVQNMNVVTAPVELRDISREIRTVGYLDFDQQKMVSVTTKFAGFIEHVYVNYVGEPVRKGDPLFEIYSPELVQTQEELLSALAFSRRLGSAPEEARGRADALADAARTRLGYWDISAAQIDRLAEGGDVLRTLTVSAPSSGIVMMRMPGLEGMSVKPGMELFHIADLSTLWLSVEVFEDQLPWLREGNNAQVDLSYFPGESFQGRVRFVEPQVNEKTRTVGLRLEVPNPDGRLRAGMYATVRFAPVVAKDSIALPSLALIRTGRRNLVIVAQGAGRFAPREVTVGAEGDGLVQVLAGLEPGEQVVTSAQFLLDSESNLREAIQKLIAAKRGTGPSSETKPPADHSGH